MQMGLDPLEFSDCLTDSPIFRGKLHEHEKELERTSKAIKTLISDGKELLNASRSKSILSSFYASYSCILFACTFFAIVLPDLNSQ